VKRKITSGQPNPGTPLSKNKASYKTLVLIYPYVVVIHLTLDTKPIMNASQPDLLTEEVFDGFLYLMTNP
jgi:hypothetical protein